MEDLDCLIIGGGSAAVACAARAAAVYGGKVALVEARSSGHGAAAPSAGGTCIIAGCVPNKLSWMTALKLTAAADAPDWDEARRRITAASLDIAASYLNKMRDAGVHLVHGEATRLLPAGKAASSAGAPLHEVTVRPSGGGAELHLRAKTVVLATGARPAVPAAIHGAKELGHTSDDFYEWNESSGRERAPPTVALVGAGHIAVEMATQLTALGCAVSMLVRPGDTILEPFDAEVRQVVVEGLQRGPYPLQAILRDFEVTALTTGPPARGPGTAGGAAPATLYLAAQDGRTAGPFHRVYFVTGRTPNSALAAEAGVQTAPKPAPPFVLTEPDTHETSVPGIYAIGDVAARMHLTPVAIFQGRRLADVLASRGIFQRDGQAASSQATEASSGTMAPFRSVAGSAGGGRAQHQATAQEPQPTAPTAHLKAGCAGGVGTDAAADVATRCENVPVSLLAYPPAGFVGLTEQLAVMKYGARSIVVFTSHPLPLAQRILHSSSGSAPAAPPLRGIVKMVCLRERRGASERAREAAGQAAGGGSSAEEAGAAGAVDPDKLQVIGLHLVGPGADEAIQGFAVAVTAGLTKADFDATLSVHPTFAEEVLGLSNGRLGREEDEGGSQ